MSDPFTSPKARFDQAGRFLLENSLLLIGGSALALIWANTNAASYHQLLHTSLIPGTQGDGYSLLHVVNDGLMALFFAMAAKEVWESLLPGGVLSKWKTAATPLMATLGGVVMPAYVYIAECWMTGRWGALGRGWAIPCATDIAFSYLVARIVFGKGHPAIAFLLLLAIADDAAGLLILAVAYPQEALQPQGMLGAVAAVAMGIAFRRFGVRSFWWYLLGRASSAGFRFTIPAFTRLWALFRSLQRCRTPEVTTACSSNPKFTPIL